MNKRNKLNKGAQFGPTTSGLSLRMKLVHMIQKKLFW